MAPAYRSFRALPRVTPALALAAGLMAGVHDARGDQIRIIDLQTNHIAYNDVDGHLYLTVAVSADPALVDSLVILDPASGSIVASMPAGTPPTTIAVSDSGRYIYVAVNGGASVRRFDRLLQMPDLDFDLGIGTSNRAYHVLDMAVMPGFEDTIAVARHHPGLTGAGVAIYDNGVVRPVVVPRAEAGRVLAWSDASDTLYNFDSSSTSYGFYRLTVTPTGVSIASQTPRLFRGGGVTMKYAGGYMYSTRGRKADPAVPRLAGTFPIGGHIAPDASNDRIAILSNSGNARVVRIFDTDTFLEVGSIPLPGIDGLNGDIVRWGDDGLAFRTTGGKLVLINTPLVRSDASGACCLPDGMCIEATYSACALQQGVWRGPAIDCSSAVCAQPGACCFVDGTCIFVLEAECGGVWLGAGVTCAGANCPPQTSTDIVRIVPLAANRLVYNPSNGTVYATVPGSVGAPRGNSITAVDPITARILGSTFIGSSPEHIVVSDSGRYIYAGLQGASAVRRFDAILNQPDIQFDIGFSNYGPHEFYDVQVMPGHESTVAVARRRESVSPPDAGVAIYDNGVQRPLTTPGHLDSSKLTWSDSPSTLYGFNGSSNSYLRRMSVGPTGVTITQTVGSLLQAANTEIRYADGYIYSSSGRKIDPQSMTVVGNFGVSARMTVDPLIRRIFFISPATGGHLVRAFDIDTLEPAGSRVFIGATGIALDLHRWGLDGLMFRTSTNQIALVNTDLIPLPICYANCDVSSNQPILNVDDFTCFINEFVVTLSLPHEQQVTSYANCDGSTNAPVLNVDDFTCFMNAFAAGCY